jgi:hypothetical protein
MALMPAGETDAPAMGLLLSPVLVQPDGRFDFTGVPPGQYVLRVDHVVTAPGSPGPSGAALQFLGQRANGMGSSGNTVNEPMQWAAQPITVGEGGVSGLSISLHTSATVKGRAEFNGGNRPTAQAMRSVVVILRPLTPYPERAMVNTIGRLTDDGTFEMRGVPPGRYAVDASSGPNFSHIQSVTVGGNDITGLPIEIGGSDVGDLVVTFTAAPMATLAGTGVNGAMTDDLVALIFPADRKFWTDPDATTTRFRLAPVGRNGSISPQALSPGEYFIAIVPDRDGVGWQDATKLEAWSARAQRVSLAESETKTVEVRR